MPPVGIEPTTFGLKILLPLRHRLVMCVFVPNLSGAAAADIRFVGRIWLSDDRGPDRRI
jgi:hypothetical protein